MTKDEGEEINQILLMVQKGDLKDPEVFKSIEAKFDEFLKKKRAGKSGKSKE